MKRPLALLCALVLWMAPLSLAADVGEDDEQYLITIVSVRLKNINNEWILVIAPDRVVDLKTEEASVTLLNNGRVAPGGYKNFEIVYLDARKSAKPVRLTSVQDFELLWVRFNSFMNVNFKIDLEKDKKVLEVQVIVDGNSRTLPEAMLRMEMGTNH